MVRMTSKTQRSPPERQHTDESLVVERKKTDEEIGAREEGRESRSDDVMRRARGRADDVLEEARHKADLLLRREDTSDAQRSALQTERTSADAAVQAERGAADQQLETERDVRKRALESLLRWERDQTDERLLIERARGDEALAARDDFMAMVSHDVRTLLGSIALTAELMIKASTDDEIGIHNRKAAERIQRCAAGIKRLVGDLVDVASLEGGRFAIDPNTQDVKALVEDSLGAFGSIAHGKEITLTGTVADGAVPAMFDHDRILQVLANLLSNALKFAPKGGTVSLSVERVLGEIRFVVSDDGHGIPAEHLESIFQRFWQVKAGDARGLGLGLFISKSIVEAHGGRVWAQSEEGRGSRVGFSLPAAP